MSTSSSSFQPISASNASANDNKNNSKIDTKSPVLWKVRHTISAADTAVMPISYLIKACFIGSCFIFTIIGSIIACITSHQVNPFEPIVPTGPVNGQWSTWLSWSPCSISCSNVEHRYGTMSRRRYCNSPPPQLSGQNCSGKSLETVMCFNKPCPIPIDGNWIEWSEWSSCGKTCKENSYTPLQTRSRTCTNPSPNHGGKACDGESKNHQFCDWLQPCPIDGQWSKWYIGGPCESRDRKSCAIGSQRHQRQCNNPPPNLYGKECEGIKEKIEDCWFFIGCPVDIQPPLNLQVTGNNTGLFNVSWSSVPYGKPAVIYRIYKTIEDENDKQINTFYEDIIAIPSKRVTGQDYWKIIDLRKYHSTKSFKTLAVRMSSIDFWKEESIMTKPDRSKSNSIDGEWGEWGYWSHCSAKCYNQRGDRTRIRFCDDPKPSDGGKSCFGFSEEKAVCMGMDDNC